MDSIKFYIAMGLALGIIMSLMLSVPYKVFAAATTQKMNIDLVVDTKTLIFQDINGNKKT